MYRVLHIMGGADAGGMAAVVWNYYKHIDRSRFCFDIALTGTEPGMLGHRIIELGAQCYRLPLKSKGLRQFKRELWRLLQNEKFDAIHVHENSTSYVALAVAKKVGIKCRIAHAHTAIPTVGLKDGMRRLSGCLLNSYYATKLVGCGKLAGESVFGKCNMEKSTAYILPNAIDSKKFSFNNEIRESMRGKLNLHGKYAIGLVGRFSGEKNQKYALELIKEIHNIVPESVLLLVGTGEDEQKICDIIERNKMSQYVWLLGKREDMTDLYQAFDLCLLTSLYEGFPVTAVEAMASGLPVVLSDTITDELKFGTAVFYVSLKDKNKWIKTVKWIYENCCTSDREQRQKEIVENQLDINQTVQILEKIYLE